MTCDRCGAETDDPITAFIFGPPARVRMLCSCACSDAEWLGEHDASGRIVAPKQAVLEPGEELDRR